jgi:hypothetical protein
MTKKTTAYPSPVTAQGHEDAFPEPRLSARCRFSQGTFAGTLGNGRDAPKAAVSPTASKSAISKPASATPNSVHARAVWVVAVACRRPDSRSVFTA